MNTLKRWIEDPKLRRQALTLLSGGLILISLAARYAAGQPGTADGLLAAAAVVAGADIVVRALANLRNRAFSIELLVSIAFIGALAIGEFWEAAAVTFLFIFGAYLEARTLSKTREVLGQLLDLASTTAVVMRDGQQVEVLASEVAQDEILLIKPGAKVPVDGLVLDGFSAVDESAITGESIPEEKGSGDAVYAGTLNQNGTLKVRATGVGADTTLARIIARVEEAQDEKAPTQRFIERFARWYTPFIIVLSIGAFIITRDIELSLTLLVIGCPGALVISTPVSIVAGIGRAAKKGILIKGGEYLENAGKISAVALDKTGTLTEGKPRLIDIEVLETVPILAGADRQADSRRGGWDAEQRKVLRWAGIAETLSEHPLARPILAEASRYETLPEPENFQMLTGRGVTAEYRGSRIAVGTMDLMNILGVAVSPEAESRLAVLKSNGKTAVLVALDQAAIGILGIADSLRDNAAEMVRELKRSGVKRVLMLTGDDRRTAEAIASQADITEVHANLLPDDKLAIIRQLKQEGHVVAMTGDGINDAPALAAADIGIAMGTAGTGIAIETADIALMADDLMKISQAIALSKSTLRNIRQNVIIALLTVSVLLAGVMMGQVHMAGGMLVHQISVLVVIINGMRLLKA
ncbi:MAG TPA: cation-translocating P-type ATPase [Smithellaceae bacterium]|jgi:Cd2+/Zn2+-exporting ATPase|nr:cation-translocating P-type ATPase [Smithellaceae bacterium]